jgi:heme-degrading monooxygenase HmoA
LYASLSRLRIPDECATDLIRAFRRRAHLVEEADGFVDLQVWQSDKDSGEIVMVSRWRDRDADPELDRVIRLERLEHLHTYEVVAE